MDLGLADRVYVLTGASRGLGFATAEQLVADGARVVISSRDPERVAAAVERARRPGAGVGLDRRPRPTRTPRSGWSPPPGSTSAASTAR